MTALLDSLQKGPLLAYCAVGSHLIARGYDLTGCVGQFFLDNPDELRWVTRQYLEAGCRIVSAAGSTCGPWKLKRLGLSTPIVEMNQRVTQIVRQETPKDRFISGSVLPSGKLLRPLGDLDPDELFAAYEEEARGYALGGADLIWVLTMIQIEEAEIAVRAAKQASGLPVIASMAFDLTPQGPRTVMGVDPQTAAFRLTQAGADLVGHNCGNMPPQAVAGIIAQMREVTDKALVVKPNAGRPELREGQTIWPCSPAEFAAQVPAWIAAGASVIGGCCGTTPAHAAAMAKAISVA